MDALGLLRAVLVAPILAWLPGYVWARVLIPEMRGVERFVLAVVLSVVMLTLCLYLGNVILDIPIGGGYALVYAFLLLVAAGTPAVVRFARSRLDASLG